MSSLHFRSRNHLILESRAKRFRTHRGTEGDEKKGNSERAAMSRSWRLRSPSVDDPWMQCVNWKRVKRMNLIALAPEERADPIQVGQSETINSDRTH